MSFQYDMTDERRAYFEARGKTILTACPGSGKTTSIVNKLSTIIREIETEYGAYSGVACLSFTNKACDEIRRKYKEINNSSIGFPHVVSTIDSFIEKYIVLPFWQLSNTPLNVRPIIINAEQEGRGDLMHKIYFHYDGTKEFIDQTFVNYAKGKNAVLWKYSPAEVAHGPGTQYMCNGNPIDKSHNVYAKLCIDFRMSKGYINSNDAEYIACCILYRNPDIAAALAKRFPYIIIDEAQDTSYHQNVVIDYLVQNGLMNVELVGDLYQSIYRWRNAYPEKLEQRMKSGEWNVLPMTECRRSVQRVIDVYSFIRKSTDENIKSLGVEDAGHPIHVYKYNDDNISEVVNRFVEYCKAHDIKDYTIVTRGNTLKNELIGKVKNQGFWKSSVPYTLLDAYLLLSNGETKKAMNSMCRLAADLKYAYNDYEGKKTYLNNVKDNYGEMALLFMALKNLPSFDLSFDVWTTMTQAYLKDALYLGETLDFGKKKKGIKDLENKSISEFYHTSHDAEHNYIEIQTIHAVKGKSIPAVLVFLSEKGGANMIAISDFKSKDKLTESQNLLYVACSRAEQYLAIAVPDSVSDDKIKSILSVSDEQIIKQ